MTGGHEQRPVPAGLRPAGGAGPPGQLHRRLAQPGEFQAHQRGLWQPAGDQTLRHILRVLEQGVGPEELAARGSGDQFSSACRGGNPRRCSRLDELVRRVNAFNEGRQTPPFSQPRQGAYRVDDPSVSVTLLQGSGQPWPVQVRPGQAGALRVLRRDAGGADAAEKTLLDLMEAPDQQGFPGLPAAQGAR